jgi:hypothetical protein
MKTEVRKGVLGRHCLPSRPVHVIRALVLLAAFTAAIPDAQALAITDDFDDGNDTGWTRLDPIGDSAGGSYASFAFPSGGYQITALQSPNSAQYGPARAGSLRQDVDFTDFVLTFDLVAFSGTEGPALGALARASNAGGDATNGYALFYYDFFLDNFSPSLVLQRITNGSSSTIAAQDLAAPLSTEESYRFEFTGSGTSLTGAVYELGNLSTPLIEVSGTDSTYASGHTGLFVFDYSESGNGTTAATFDNYSVVPEPTTLAYAGIVLASLLLRRRALL